MYDRYLRAGLLVGQDQDATVVGFNRSSCSSRASYLSVSADRTQVHSVECARVAELDDLIGRLRFDTREAICPDLFAQTCGNVDIRND